MSARPNILFFFPDQHRPDWLGDNPHLPLRTPNILRLMKSGTTFTRAYCQSPLCAPSRATLASGKGYERCGVPDNHTDYPLNQPTYYQALRDAGYRVAGVGKFDLHKNTSDFSKLDWHLDGSRLIHEWGFTEGIDNEGKLDGTLSYRAAGGPKGPYMKFLDEQGLANTHVAEHSAEHAHKDAYVTALPEEAYCDNWVAENGLQLLRDFPEGTPWHLVVNCTGPHNPMDVTQRMHDAWENVQFPPPHNDSHSDYSTEDHQWIRRHYAAMIENIDRQIGRFMEALKERGELENTLIVYASDHGEMLGDHGKWGKCVYHEASLKVPLIIAGPTVRRGAVSDALVSLHDLAATFVDIAEADPMPDMDAKSLMPVLRGETREHRPVVAGGLTNWRAVVGRQFKLIEREDERPILHDLRHDPWEDKNIAAEHPDKVAQLQSHLPCLT